MALSDIINKTLKTFKSNSPEILAALGVSGVVTTSYLTARSTWRARGRLESESPYDSKKERFKKVWKFYIPPVVSGVATVACIVGSQKSSARRTTAAVTAYSLSERLFSEYRDKVVETIGKTKEQKIHDEIVQDRVNRNPPSEMIVIGDNQVLCCEGYTGRYFKSDMETLRRAVNDINFKCFARNELYVARNDFYELVGLDPTTDSDITGWNFEKPLELTFSTALDSKGRPCMVFDYNYVKLL